MALRLFPIIPIGLIAGTLDIGENLIFNSFRGVTPWRVFQYISSGLIGRSSFELGWTSVLLGVMIHFAIAFIWTTVFFLTAQRIQILPRRPILSGLIFGAVIYVVMTFLVVPLSGVPPPGHPPTLVARINAVLALLFCIGLTISLLTRRSLGSNRG